MNVKYKKQPPKPDRKNINNSDKITRTRRSIILKFYETGLKNGKSSSALLEELSNRFNRSKRQIERYIRSARNETYTKPSPAMLDHWNKLIIAAKALSRGISLPPDHILDPETGSHRSEWAISMGEIYFTAEKHYLY